MRAQLSDPVPTELKNPYSAPYCTVHGKARGSMFHPEGYSLWCIVGELEVGTALEWASAHGDEGLYVVSGLLEADGALVKAGSAVVIEAGVPALIRAHEDTRFVHCGPTAADPPTGGTLGAAAESGHGIHVITREEGGRIGGSDSADGPIYYCDGTCPTCRIAFFVMDFPKATEGYSVPSHTHSEDEIIHVLDGVLQIGPLKVAAGMSIAVPKELRYGFRTSGPFRFLNYRRDVSLYTSSPGTKPLVETLPSMRQAAHYRD